MHVLSFPHIPLRKWVWVSLFLFKLCLELSEGSSLSVQPITAPEPQEVPWYLWGSVCHQWFPLAVEKRAASLSFLNCVQEGIIVPSELPTGGFRQVSYLWGDFKSVYFPLLPFPPPLLLSHFVLLLKYYRSVSACKCCHWANVCWLRILMKRKSDNLCKIIRPN